MPSNAQSEDALSRRGPSGDGTVAEITALNVDVSCTTICEDCEKYFDCQSPVKAEIYSRRRMGKVVEALCLIRHKVAIAGGKGGVGKSSVSSNLALALAERGLRVTILDHDFDGPSIPRMLGVNGKKLRMGKLGIVPVSGHFGVEVVSMGCVNEAESVLTWFHDARRSATEEFLAHVDYGERDFLLIDLPPGTSSDSVNLLQHIPDITGVVLVTVPSAVSQDVARKAGLLCRKAGVEIIAVVENMSGYVCGHCGSEQALLNPGGGAALAKELGVETVIHIPMDPRMSACADGGTCFLTEYGTSPAANRIRELGSVVIEFSQLAEVAAGKSGRQR